MSLRRLRVQRDGVVGRNFGADADSALGEARGVVEDGALHPVDPARVGRVSPLTVFV